MVTFFWGHPVEVLRASRKRQAEEIENGSQDSLRASKKHGFLVDKNASKTKHSAANKELAPNRSSHSSSSAANKEHAPARNSQSSQSAANKEPAPARNSQSSQSRIPSSAIRQKESKDKLPQTGGLHKGR